MVNEQENLKYCFYEISEILKNMPIEYNEKLPDKLKNLIYENKISNEFIYNKDKTLDNQEMLQDTKILLSILYRTYWCSAEKRTELKEQDNNILKEKYNPDNIFKNHNKEINKDMSMIEYKESLLIKIINKIKNIFKR